MDLNRSIRTSPAFQSGSPYLKAADYEGQTLAFTIANVDEDVFTRPNEDDQTRFILVFNDANKSAIVLNKTNTKALEARYGDIPANWIGRVVHLGTKAYNFDGNATHGWILSHPPVANPVLPTGQPIAAPIAATIAAQAPQVGAPVAPLNEAVGDTLPLPLVGGSNAIPGT